MELTVNLLDGGLRLILKTGRNFYGFFWHRLLRVDSREPDIQTFHFVGSRNVDVNVEKFRFLGLVDRREKIVGGRGLESAGGGDRKLAANARRQ